MVDAKDNHGQYDSAAKQNVGQGRELSLKGCTLGQAKELANNVIRSFSQANNRLSLTVLAPVHGAAGLALLLGGRSSNLADLCQHTGGSDNTAASTLSDNGRGVGHVDTVTDANLLFTGGMLLGAGAGNIVFGDFLDRDGLASKLPLFAGQIHGLEDAEVCRDGVTRLEQNNIAGNNIGAKEVEFS